MGVRRNTRIAWFVIGWLLIFTYETLRYSHLTPWLRPLIGRELPKLPLLFPPAGWIMFYRIDNSHGSAEVYGIRGNTRTLIDPHDILETKAVGYDNIRRNVLIGVLDEERAPDFCAFLERKFPEYDGFLVVYAQYPNLTGEPDRVERYVAYPCPLR